MIQKIIHEPYDRPCYAAILFAEYLEKKHNRGYVVFWLTAGQPHWSVETVEDYYKEPVPDWYGEAAWHTDIAHKYLTPETPDAAATDNVQ